MVIPKYVARRLVAFVMLVMILGSGSVGFCWCTLFDSHDGDDHAASQVQIVEVETDCCTCELCICCGHGVPALVAMSALHEVPEQPVAITVAPYVSRVRNQADDIFIPPKSF